MVSSEEEKKKKIKLKDESSENTSISTVSLQDEMDNDEVEDGSESNFIYLSDEKELFDCNCESSNSGETLEYFPSSDTTTEESASEIVWVDSEEQNFDVKEDNAAWLKPGENQKLIRKNIKKITFKYLKNIFTAKCKIKIFRCFPNFKVLVDSFNLIYFIFDLEGEMRFKTFKIELYKITNVCYFANKILFFSNSSSFIKEVTVDGVVTDIKKGMGNIVKMVAYENSLYVLGDKVYRLNSSLFIKNEFNMSFIDITCINNVVLCMNENGEIYVFDSELNFKEKLSFSHKFQFKNLYTVRDYAIITTEDGMIILNKDLKEIKEFTNLSSPITALAYNNDFIFHGSDYKNSFRILKEDLTYFDKFPFAKIKINSIPAMDVENDTVYFAESKFISSIKINYI